MISPTEQYTWTINVSPLYPRTQWNTKTINRREDLELILKYLGIDKAYKGPGDYQEPAYMTVVKVTCKREDIG